MAQTPKEFNLNCPVPHREESHVLLSHGSGGKHMHALLESVFMPIFDNPLLNSRHDGAVFNVSGKLAYTTDSYVIYPLLFKGGDIGSLSIHGTVNDLAMCGARPLYLSCGFIIEEGLPMDLLKQIVRSMKAAADEANVMIVTGDTKVVDRGKADGLFINTSGVGIIEHELTIASSSIRPNDALIVSGDLGRHGMAIMAEREGLTFETTIESDSAIVSKVVLDLIEKGIKVHCLRDLTRGGLASALVEIAGASKLNINIEEKAIPVREEVNGACEILGLDPIYVANEGRFVAFVPQEAADKTIEILRQHPVSEGACQLGNVGKAGGKVWLKSRIGATRIVDMLSGDQLPRIC